MNKIFDSHAHYDDEAFDEDRYGLLSSLPQKGVCCVINNAVDVKSARRCLTLAHSFPFIYAAVGIHPHEAAHAKEEDFSCLRDMLLDENKVVAIGEIGLDYHYDFSERSIQRTVFERQLKLARELNMPVIIHDREAHGDTMDLLRRYRPSGVIHCFSGSVEMAREAVNLGLFIGLGGAVTFKNARHPLEVAAAIPLSSLLLETDAPYMSPVPLRGKRCDSTMIAYTAMKIAQVRGISQSEVFCAAAENAARLFHIRMEEPKTL